MIGDAAASMLSGEAVDTIHRGLTGQSFGRGVANIFGATNLYDRSGLARFGFDAINPGYFMGGLATKGVNLISDKISKLKVPSNVRFLSKHTFDDTESSVDRLKTYISDYNKVHNDVNNGKTDALNYLQSEIKRNTDQHNIDLARRAFGWTIAPATNPWERAATKMIDQRFPKIPGRLHPELNVKFVTNLGDSAGEIYINHTNPKLDEISFSLSDNLDNTAFHEYLHRGLVADGRDAVTRNFYNWKINIF